MYLLKMVIFHSFLYVYQRVIHAKPTMVIKDSAALGDGGGAAAHAGGGHCSSAQPIRTLSRGPQGLGWICG
jgi:hypothetical protein